MCMGEPSFRRDLFWASSLGDDGVGTLFKLELLHTAVAGKNKQKSTCYDVHGWYPRMEYFWSHTSLFLNFVIRMHAPFPDQS